MKLSTQLICLLLLAGCATSSTPAGTDQGSRQVHGNAVLHQGPELAATLVHPSGKRSVGEEWLVLAAELTSPQGSRPVVVSRSDISARTPDGRRLTLISQDEFRRNFPRLRIPVERSLEYFPLLDRYEFSRQVPCDRWFLVAPPEILAFDEIPLSSSQICSGPLVFEVPGGIQPGRWRLIIELEESTADLPFIVELDN